MLGIDTTVLEIDDTEHTIFHHSTEEGNAVDRLFTAGASKLAFYAFIRLMFTDVLDDRVSEPIRAAILNRRHEPSYEIV